MYSCDYGHDHRSLKAKQACEARNDQRGLPRSAREAKAASPVKPALPPLPDYFGRWRA